MIIVKFEDGSDWFKPNWIFRQLAQDIVTASPNDCVLRSIMDKAQAFGGLFIASMEPDIAAATLQAIMRVAEATIEGRIPGWKQARPNDKEGQKMYLKAITELVDIIKTQQI